VIFRETLGVALSPSISNFSPYFLLRVRLAGLPQPLREHLGRSTINQSEKTTSPMKLS
jgi:hypothetical protein